MSNALTPRVDLTGLLSSPSAQFNLLAAAIARNDMAGARDAQVALRGLGWLVLGPDQLDRIEQDMLAEDAAADVEDSERPGPRPTPGGIP